MNDQQTWVEALNINPESLTEWSAQAPAGKPILVYCLEQGLVDYGAYMRWAQERFELPLLQANFFQSAIDKDLVEASRNSGNWNPWLFPVDRWDGVTLVACVEPPSEDIGENVRYVLADPRAMTAAWGEPTEVSQLAPPPLPDLAPPPVDMPIGMSLETKAFVLDLNDALFNIGDELPDQAAPPKVEPPAVKTDTNLSLVLDVPFTAKEPAKESVKEAAEVTHVAPAAPPALRVVNAAPAAAPSQPSRNSGKVGSARVDENATVTALFETLAKRFEAALIMKCEDQIARLYKWDSKLNPTEDTEKTSVNLSYPTFLRIVAKTNMPYHGYLVESPAHSEFFSALGVKGLPVCVTAIPVRYDDVLWGVVIAFGKEENQRMESLSFVQEAVERLMNTMAQQWAKIA